MLSLCQRTTVRGQPCGAQHLLQPATRTTTTTPSWANVSSQRPARLYHSMAFTMNHRHFRDRHPTSQYFRRSSPPQPSIVAYISIGTSPWDSDTKPRQKQQHAKRTQKIDMWPQRIQELTAYREQHGHTRVPKRYADNPALGNWVARQRTLYAQHLAGDTSAPQTAERRAQLTALDFHWPVTPKQKKKKKKSVGTRVDDKTDATWNVSVAVSAPVDMKKEHSLLDKKEQRRREKLADRHTVHPPDKESVSVQKEAHIAQGLPDTVDDAYVVNASGGGTAAAAAVRVVEDDGFRREEDVEEHTVATFEPIDLSYWHDDEEEKKELSSSHSGGGGVDNWPRRVQELRAFCTLYDHAMVPYIYKPNPALGNWVDHQRKQYRKHLTGLPNSLTEERIAILNGLGFCWDNFSMAWTKRILQLRRFREKQGHVNIPNKFQDDPTLSKWVQRQRLAYASHMDGEKNHMTAEKIETLNKLGFCWDILAKKQDQIEKVWAERTRELEEFKCEHRHTEVPRSYERNLPLANWVHRQRKAYRKHLRGETTTLTTEKIERLNQLEFCWQPDEDGFLKRIRELEAFREEHGHANVPQFCSKHPILSNWVHAQRTLYRKHLRGKAGPLTASRIEMLNALHFRWEQSTEKLVE